MKTENAVAGSSGARPRVSARGDQMPASPIRRLMPLAEEAKRQGVRVLHLNIGQPDLETPAPMRERLARYPDKVIAYTPSGGTSEYLAFLVEYYRRLGLSLTPEELTATTGGSEAILFAFLACADAGDEALTVEPFYTNYSAFATMAGVKIVALTTQVENGFHLPPRAAWEAACTPRARLVLLCNPNNPTGTVYSPDELAEVGRFCRDRGLFLVSDEVYREFVYDGRRTVSALTLEGAEDFVVVYLPAEKIVIEADHISPRNGQVRPAPSVKEFIPALDKLNLDVATIVGIHGDSATLQAARAAAK